MKILTYNVPDHTNMSYWHTMNKLMSHCSDIHWFYGPYGYTGGQRKMGNVTFIPNPTDKAATHPPFLQNDLRHIKPDILFMHEDPQRCMWFNSVEKVPIIYWLPMDNEDKRLKVSKKTFTTADKIVLVAKFAQSFLKNYGYDFEQIYNPVNTREFYHDEEGRKLMRKEIGIADDEILLTWVGSPGWRKRFTHILEIARRCMKKNDKVKLLLHMDKNKLPFRVEELLYAMDLDQKHVFFPKNFNGDIGYTVDDMRRIYNATDIYIAPHGGEGMCIPICEAMACKKPFIATDVTTTQEFADYPERGKDMIGKRGIGAKIKTYFEDKGIDRPYVDIDDFVNKVEFLIERPDLREEMGENGRKFVEEEVDSFVIGQKWKKIFYEYGTLFEAKYIGANIHQGQEREDLPPHLR